jgi:hypothetical protein
MLGELTIHIYNVKIYKLFRKLLSRFREIHFCKKKISEKGRIYI